MELADVLSELEQYALAHSAGLQQEKPEEEAEPNQVVIADLIQKCKEVPEQSCSAREWLVTNLKQMGMNAERRRHFINSVEWDTEISLMQLPADCLVRNLERLAERGSILYVDSVCYMAQAKVIGRWLR